ncbi:unnamed protein product [Pleuronectes platessa]|uniref:Uncharacterized protein n=1 Tax=Pleuronectes platessa TaxID=8262 RepID=A0A9N7YM80_PLEPL|nr:unnamed protein product [Pleuronectes platessa]
MVDRLGLGGGGGGGELLHLREKVLVCFTVTFRKSPLQDVGCSFPILNTTSDLLCTDSYVRSSGVLTALSLRLISNHRRTSRLSPENHRRTSQRNLRSRQLEE